MAIPIPIIPSGTLGYAREQSTPDVRGGVSSGAACEPQRQREAFSHAAVVSLSCPSCDTRLRAEPQEVKQKSVMEAERQSASQDPVSGLTLTETGDAVGADSCRGGEDGSDASTPSVGSAGTELTETETAEVNRLTARDREVRAHEAAHAAVGGSLAGSPSYTFEVGPDGQHYAVEGEVPIQVAVIASSPERTVQKMQQIQRAALAPAQPSAVDRQIAARAVALEQLARSELVPQNETAASDARRAGGTLNSPADSGFQSTGDLGPPRTSLNIRA